MGIGPLLMLLSVILSSQFTGCCYPVLWEYYLIGYSNLGTETYHVHVTGDVEAVIVEVCLSLRSLDHVRGLDSNGQRILRHS